MSAARYLELTPLGVVRGLSDQHRDDAAALLRVLLRRDADQAWATGELRALLPGDLTAWARLLFQLQREGCIDVHLAPPGVPEAHWNGVQSDLAAMVAQGASQAVLMDADGLVLAQAGADGAADDAMQPPPAASVRLQVGDGALAAVYGLALRGLSSDHCRPLVRLARRLARARTWH